jgi:hypothetical protein
MRVSAGVCLHAVAAVIFIVAGALPQLFLGAQEDFAFSATWLVQLGLYTAQQPNAQAAHRLPTMIASKQCDAAAVLGGQLVETVVEEEWWKYVQDLPHVRVD